MRIAVVSLSVCLFITVFISCVIDTTHCELIQSRRIFSNSEQRGAATTPEENDEHDEVEEIMEVAPRMMAGGYSTVDDITTNPRLMDVAKYVIETIASPAASSSSSLTPPVEEGENDNAVLPPNKYTFQSELLGKTLDQDYTIQLLHASQQVVAGMNYRLSIGIINNAKNNNNKQQQYIGGLTVTVYDHFGNLSISSWGKEISSSEIQSFITKSDNGKLLQSIELEFNNGL